MEGSCSCKGAGKGKRVQSEEGVYSSTKLHNDTKNCAHRMDVQLRLIPGQPEKGKACKPPFNSTKRERAGQRELGVFSCEHQTKSLFEWTFKATLTRQ